MLTHCDLKSSPGITNKEFKEGVFHTVPDGACVYGTSFTHPPDQAPPGVWLGGPIRQRSLVKRSNYTSGEANTFYVVSTFYPDADGRCRRSKDSFAAAHVLTIDDVGGGPSAKIPWDKIKLEPSFVIETSPGNCQPGYILETPEADADYFTRVVKAMIAQGLAEDKKDPGMVGVTRYVRMPVGLNNKTKYDPPHQHVLKEWRPELRYTLQDIVDAYGLDLAPPARERTERTYQTHTPVTIDALADPYIPVLNQLGLILTGKIRNGNMLDILCPWHEEHGDRPDGGTVYFLGGGWDCKHGHCEDRTSREFRQKLAEEHPFDPDEFDHIIRACRVGSVFGETE
jgi:hypothetical protein